jgi:hypothetical protein
MIVSSSRPRSSKSIAPPMGFEATVTIRAGAPETIRSRSNDVRRK